MTSRLYVEAPFAQAVIVEIDLPSDGSVDSANLIGATLHVSRPGSREAPVEWAASITQRAGTTSCTIRYSIADGDLTLPGDYRLFVVFDTAGGPLGTDTIHIPVSPTFGG